MILLAIIIYATNSLEEVVLSITYPLLEGSSEGKSLILLTVMGSMLLLYTLFTQNGIIANKILGISPKFSFESQKYLKITIILIFITYLIGLSLEIVLRAKLGVSIFTIFVSFSDGPSTTSLTHSHVLKSFLGALIQVLGIQIPSDINTGVSLAPYFSPVLSAIFILFPMVYLTGLVSLSKRSDLIKILISFGLTISIIGMLDGGLFSTPALIGLFVLLSVYFVNRPFTLKKISKPMLIVILLILLRLSIGVIGTNTDFHEITIINPSEDIKLSGYNVFSVEKYGNKMIVKVPGNTHDKVLLIRLIEDLNGKCSGFFLSWNIYSWT